MSCAIDELAASHGRGTTINLLLEKRKYLTSGFVKLFIGTDKVGGECIYTSPPTTPHAITTAFRQSESVLNQSGKPKAYLVLLLPPRECSDKGLLSNQVLRHLLSQ